MSVFSPIDDEAIVVSRRIKEITRGIDAKEMAEREEAAMRLSQEDEKHFISYCMDCITTSVNHMKPIREQQKECLAIYNEEPPPNYGKKEDWQSKVIIPKPYQTILFAESVTRKAFDVEFLSIENEKDEKAANFWEKLMKMQLSKNFADFPTYFTDAVGLAFAIGQSYEIIPSWHNGRLKFTLVEPSKIHRDPDAISRDPQSGMYWIHQEFIDYHVLKQMEKDGKYVNIDAVKEFIESVNSINPDISKEELARRKEMVWHRSSYRKSILVSEFWGIVLDKNGEILLPNATYTIAGNKIIRYPTVSPYKTMRFPGVSFSALPMPTRYDGRSLLKSIKSLWYFMCSLLCLHNDSLNWIVNPMMEIDISSLVDVEDLDIYPGKTFLTRGTVSGQQSVRPIEHRFRTNEILANLHFADQNFQRGTFVTDVVQGLPGYRAEITAREAAQNLDQAMTIFSLIGKNLEDGALQIVRASAEVMLAYMSLADLIKYFDIEEVQDYIDEYADTGLALPELTTGSFHVSGISAMMKDTEIIKGISEMILPLAGNPMFSPYLKPYNILKSIERRLNLRDEHIIVTEQEAVSIEEQAKMQTAQMQAGQPMPEEMPPELANVLEGGEVGA